MSHTPGKTKWMLEAKKADFYGLGEKFHLDPLTIRLMVNRGIRTEEEIRRFLYAGWQDEYDPHRMKGAEEAARRLYDTIQR